MGATIKGFDDAYNGSEIQAYTVDKLSTAVVRVLNALAEDEEIFKLLYFEKDDSLGIDLVTNPQAQAIFTSKRIKTKTKNKDWHPIHLIRKFKMNIKLSFVFTLIKEA